MTNWIEQIYRVHSDLLGRVEQSGASPALVADAQALIAQARQAGRYVSAAQDREYIHTLLNFWGSWVYKQTRVYPNIDLYPAAPPGYTVIGGDTPLSPPSAQSILPEAPAAKARATGQPFILASIAAPPDGTSAAAAEKIALVGIYANLRPAWQLHFITQDQIGRLTLLDEGFRPAERPDAGTWSAEFTPATAGMYHLGVMLAITPAAAAACRAVFAEGRAFDATPEGAITFADLVVLTVRS